MSKLTIELDDKSARLVEEAARSENKSVDEWARESISQAASRTVEAAPKERVFGLHRDAIWMAPDFNDPLPEMAPYS